MAEISFGTIVIHRKPEPFMEALGLNVILDGKVLDKISTGDSKEFRISKGDHKISVGYKWFWMKKATDTIEFDLRDETIEFICESRYKGLAVFVSHPSVFSNDGGFKLSMNTK